MASTQRHKARGDEVVKFGAPTAPDTLLSVMETYSHTYTHTCRATTQEHADPFTHTCMWKHTHTKTYTHSLNILKSSSCPSRYLTNDNM